MWQVELWKKESWLHAHVMVQKVQDMNNVGTNSARYDIMVQIWTLKSSIIVSKGLMRTPGSVLIVIQHGNS